MRLNLDCVRDILLTVEDKSVFGRILSLPAAFDESVLEKYGKETLQYHVQQCLMSGLLIGAGKASVFDFAGNATIKDLSPQGHEFLANIRSDTTWKKVKETSKAVGTESLSAIKDIAAQVIAAIVTAQFKA